MVSWRPLATYLRAETAEDVVLTYDEISDILGGPLPASATRHRPIVWSNAERNAYSQHWRSAGFRASLRDVGDDEVRFIRVGAPEPVDAPAPARLPVSHLQKQAFHADVVLVGCVKSKAEGPMPARDLYTSPLFAKRRAYAEASGRPWVVLSAEHGVVAPDEVIAPYDRFLEEQPASYRDRWGRRVVEKLEQRFGPLDGVTFELHASVAYGDPIEPELTARGAELRRPLRAGRFGEQLAWYDAHQNVVRAQPSRPPTTPASAPIASTGAVVVPPPPPPSSTSGLARRISGAFLRGELDLSARGPSAPRPSWAAMPEVRAVAVARELGASPTQVRWFCTFVSAVDRARDADVLWDRAAAAFDAATWLFQPDEVTKRRFTELVDALRRTGLSQRHGQDAAAWRIIAESLVDAPADDPIRRAVEAGEGDARGLLAAVQATTAGGTDRYPLLRGPKIRAMWVRILAHPGGAAITHLDAVPVAVDVQVRRVTEHLGVTATAGRELDDVRVTIQDAWYDDVARGGAVGPDGLADTAAALDPALWFWGKWGCSFCEGVGEKRPIHAVCSACTLRPATSTGGPPVTSPPRSNPNSEEASEPHADLETAFHTDLVGTTTEMIDDVGYRPTRYQQMLSQHGGVETARRLLQAQGTSEGFTRLWEAGRLDLAAEARVLLPRFAQLFSANERRIARRRLEDHEFDLDRWLRQARKMGAIHEASSLEFPTADVEQMNAEVEQGYRGR